jgi:hypothetical protein
MKAMVSISTIIHYSLSSPALRIRAIQLIIDYLLSPCLFCYSRDAHYAVGYSSDAIQRYLAYEPYRLYVLDMQSEWTFARAPVSSA